MKAKLLVLLIAVLLLTIFFSGYVSEDVIQDISTLINGEI